MSLKDSFTNFASKLGRKKPVDHRHDQNFDSATASIERKLQRQELDDKRTADLKAVDEKAALQHAQPHLVPPGVSTNRPVSKDDLEARREAVEEAAKQSKDALNKKSSDQLETDFSDRLRKLADQDQKPVAAAETLAATKAPVPAATVNQAALAAAKAREPGQDLSPEEVEEQNQWDAWHDASDEERATMKPPGPVSELSLESQDSTKEPRPSSSKKGMDAHVASGSESGNEADSHEPPQADDENGDLVRGQESQDNPRHMPQFVHPPVFLPDGVDLREDEAAGRPIAGSRDLSEMQSASGREGSTSAPVSADLSHDVTDGPRASHGGDSHPVVAAIVEREPQSRAMAETADSEAATSGPSKDSFIHPPSYDLGTPGAAGASQPDHGAAESDYGEDYFSQAPGDIAAQVAETRARRAARDAATAEHEDTNEL